MMGVIILTFVALGLGMLLVFIEDHFSSDSKKLEEIEKLLPGYNCGACGFGGCHGMAEAIIEDESAYLKCRPMKVEMKEKLEDFLRQR